MYGPEYLDWRDKTAVADRIDEFLAGLGQEDRVWAMAVLRERHTVYKDNPFTALQRSALSEASTRVQQNALPGASFTRFGIIGL